MIFLSISESVLLFVTGAGILQALILAGLLCFHPRTSKPGTLFLALYIVFLSIPMAMPVIQHFFSWQAMILIDPFTFLIGPFLYLYVRSFREEITWRKAYPHFILFAIFFILDIWNYSAAIAKYPASNRLPEDLPHTTSFNLVIGIRIVQLVTYYFFSRAKLNSYQRAILHIFSDTSRIGLVWVRWLVNGFIILIIALIIDYPLVIKYPQHVNLLILINTAMITPYIYMATIKGLVQPALWQIHPEIKKDRVEEEMNNAEEIETLNANIGNSKQLSTNEFSAKLNEIISRIKTLMEREKIYQEPELTLQQLGDRVQIPSYQISQAINEGMKKNFYDLVNGYRVEEAKRLLLEPKSRNYTILSVGFEAGFNSKTTFNTVFKKFTGLTPTEYRDKQKAGIEQV
jgi:AraC-like DNA-binding protein